MKTTITCRDEVKTVLCTCNKEKEISEIHTTVKELQKAIMGNGREGLLQEWNQAKGAFMIMKFAVGGGWVLAITAIILQLI